jgi:hypothetical protein
VTWLGIYVNLGLFVMKLGAGVLGRSAAMVADAGHTLSDLVSDAGQAPSSDMTGGVLWGAGGGC